MKFKESSLKASVTQLWCAFPSGIVAQEGHFPVAPVLDQQCPVFHGSKISDFVNQWDLSVGTFFPANIFDILVNLLACFRAADIVCLSSLVLLQPLVVLKRFWVVGIAHRDSGQSWLLCFSKGFAWMQPSAAGGIAQVVSLAAPAELTVCRKSKLISQPNRGRAE